MSTQGAPPAVKTCPECAAENRPLAPSCVRCGYDFRTAARVAVAHRNRNLGWVSAGVVALVLTGFASYYLWYAANDPPPTPRPTAIVRVALAASPTPRPTPSPTRSASPIPSPTFRLMANADVIVNENCCNPAGKAYSKIVLVRLGKAPPSPKYVVSADLPELFAVQPAIDAKGSLTFRTAPNHDGVATVSVRAAGETVPAQSFTITVQHANQPPVANDDVMHVAAGATARQLDVLANDFAGPPDEQPGGTHADTLTIVGVEPSFGGGTVTIAAGGSALLYTPAPGFTGTELVRYQVQDGGGLRSGFATVYITVGP
jgi:Bacterial Ig domain